MDEHVLAQLIAAHSQYPQALRAIVEGLAVSDFRARPGEQGWSPLEILVHLRDEEIEDFRARAQAAASGSAIEREIDPQGWVTSRRYNDEDPERILDQLTAEREKSCAWLCGLGADDLARSVKESPHGPPLTCADFVAAWRMHDLLHLRQLATTLARLQADRLGGLSVGYAGEIP